MVTDDLLFLTSTPQALHVGMRLRVGQVIACVGGGSTGYVYRVQDEIGGLIAVREYFPSAIALRTDGMVRPQPGFEAVFQEGQRLFDEDGWQLAAQDHPGLVKVHQVWSERGTSYLAMPWCEGHTLGQIVRASPMPPSQAQICIWLRAIADALSVIHRRRGVHGNLSLDQVMLLGSGRLLLMEFARARRAVARDPRDIERDPFAALECGTDPRCGPVGAWTDVYAIAAMLHFMLRGRAPQAPVHRAAFDAQEPLSQIKALVAAGYSEEFLHGIDRGLAVRARARPQSLPEFLALLGLRERRSRQRATGESLLINLPVSDAAPAVDESTAHASVASPGEVIDVAVQPEVSAEHEDTVPVEPEDVDEPVPSQADAQLEPATARSAPWPTSTVPTLTEPVEAEAEAEAQARAEVEEDEADASVPPAVPLGTSHFARQHRPRMSATLVMACVAGLGAMAAFGGAWLAQADLAPEALSKIQLPTPAPQQARDAARMARADAASQASAAGASSPIPDPMEPTAAGPTAPAPADRIEPSFQAAPALGSASPEAATGASAAPEAPNVNINEPSTPTAPVEAKPSAKRPAAAASPPSNTRSGAKASEPQPAEAQPPTSRVIEEATDASALSRRCPELLARQYTGPPLGAAERELVRTQCR